MRQWLKYIFSGCLLLVAIVGQVLADPLSEAQQAYLQGDYTKAVELVRPLAEQGNVLAQYNLGVMYADEQGKKHDYQEAVKWFRLAAEQGDADAQVWLGAAYAGGRGCYPRFSRSSDLVPLSWQTRACECTT